MLLKGHHLKQGKIRIGITQQITSYEWKNDTLNIRVFDCTLRVTQ